MLNLKYGQQAVSRGFITPQRLQQVLAKQRQLADQGKKVSVRMILEKSKLLTPDQLDQVDRDLNIKVVKKKTSTINKAALQQRQPQKPVQAVSATNFMGDEALPDVSGSQGANPDATIYSPPPPDMQERIRQEREKAKAAVRQKYDQQSGTRGVAPQPARPAAPPPRPAPQPAFAEPMMEPEMEPEPFGEAAPELERMDSSPKIEALPAEYQGIQSPEAEALPTLDAGGFDSFGEAPQAGGFDNLAPAEQGFDQFGEQGGMAGTAPLGAEPDQGNWGEDAAAAPSFDDGGGAPLDATMYSPPPPQYQPQAEAPEMQPQGFDSFGEDEAPAAPAFGDVGEPAAMDATLYSPPPSAMPSAEPEALPEPEAEPEMAEPSFGEESPAFGEPEPVAPPPPSKAPAKPAAPSAKEPPVTASGRKLPPGKKLVDDFAGAEAEPSGKPPAGLDDVPTVKPRGEPVHPLRRGVSSEIDALDSKQPTVKKPSTGRPEPVKAEAPKPGSGKLPKKAPPAEEASVDLPSDDEGLEEPAPTKPSKPEPKRPEPKADSKKAKPAPVSETPLETPKKKSKASTLLVFVLLLLVVVAALVVPVVPEAQDKVPQLRQLRNNEHAAVLYDKVEQWANWLRGQMGLPPWKTGKGTIKPPITGNPEGTGPEDNKDQPKEEPKDTPKEEPKDTPKEAPKADAEAQWKALYKPGAWWITKMNMGMEMWTKTEVISVDGTKARIRTSSKMKADDEFANGMESDVEFKAPAAGGEPDPKWKELGKGEETVNGIECMWVEGEYDGAKSKVWTAKRTGLVIKMTNAQGSMEVTEFKEGE